MRRPLGLQLMLFTLASTLLLMFISACQSNSEEDKVRKVIFSVRKAAEGKDLKMMLSRVSKAYRDPQGNDYEGIKNMILFYFFRHQKISILLPDIDVTVDALSANARFEAFISSSDGSNGTILPEALGAYRFHVSLNKDLKNKEWKIISARWQRVGDAGPGDNE